MWSNESNSLFLKTYIFFKTFGIAAMQYMYYQALSGIAWFITPRRLAFRNFKQAPFCDLWFWFWFFKFLMSEPRIRKKFLQRFRFQVAIVPLMFHPSGSVVWSVCNIPPKCARAQKFCNNQKIKIIVLKFAWQWLSVCLMLEYVYMYLNRSTRELRDYINSRCSS